ncbi:MAG: 3-isopropylmalate dehydratase small subunit [Candidatus Bathyarchaeota archaeon]
MEKKIIEGKVWKFGDDINTDVIIPGKYKFKTLNMKDLAEHAMEGVDPNFSKKVNAGDLMVGGKNFGCGSSREHAPRVLKELGVGAVVAGSFARIFYRNAINVGLPVIESEDASKNVSEGDIISINVAEGSLKNLSNGKIFSFKRLPSFLLEILECGGLIAYFKKFGGFKI